MGFLQAVGSCFAKYITFSGRARRAEYWWFLLFGSVGMLGLGFLDGMIFQGDLTEVSPLANLFNLAILLPLLSVSIRRLHDLERSGWWWWLGLIPLVGPIILIVWFATSGTKGPNKYGPDPLSDHDAGPNDDENAQSYSRSHIPTVMRD